MTTPPNVPDTSGVGMMALGAGGIAYGAALFSAVVYATPESFARVGTEHGWWGWADIAVWVLGGIFAFGCPLVVLVIGITALCCGIGEFRIWRAAPVRRPFFDFDRVKEFYEDLRGDDVAGSPHAAPPRHVDGLADIDRLSPDLADVVRPFLAPNTRLVRPERLQEILVEATQLLQARERYARQEKATIDHQTELDLARARAAFVAGLTEEERAILAASAANRSKLP